MLRLDLLNLHQELSIDCFKHVLDMFGILSVIICMHERLFPTSNLFHICTQLHCYRLFTVIKCEIQCTDRLRPCYTGTAEQGGREARATSPQYRVTNVSLPPISKLLRGPCYTAQISQQLASQCRCETSCRRIAQCSIGCLAFIFGLHETLHEVELSSNDFWQRIAETGNTIAQYIPSSKFSRNFTAVWTSTHAHTSRFIVPRSSWY